MGLRPGPHVCLLPGHLGGLHLATALPLGAAHGLGGGWQGPARPVWPTSHWWPIGRTTGARPLSPPWCVHAPQAWCACCMCHAKSLGPATRHGPGGIQTLGAWFWHTQAQGQLAAFVPHSCVVLGSRFGNNGQPAGARKNSRRLVPPGWLTLAHHGWPMHPRCPLPCPLRQPPKPHLAQAAAQPAPAVAGTGAATHGPPPWRTASHAASR